MNTLRLGSGRQFRSTALVEMPLPLVYDAALLPGARVLGTDGQIYESMRDVVSGLYEWKVRAQGERGPAVELQKSLTHLQWRVEGSPGPWIDLVPLEDLLGPKGQQGDTGPSGPGFAFQGSVATVANLPNPSTQGYAYLVTATGDLHIYSGTAWINSGPIQGPKGDEGDPGSEVELQKTSTEIQWRLVGAATWTTLVLLADLKGDAGASVELRKTTTEIQWRLVGAASWITLVLLDDIKGPVGDTGIQGPPGPGFSYRGAVATVGDLPIPSTQGFGFRVTATGDLHIFNGSAWVNAGQLQGPKGDQGDIGNQGPPGNSFSYQGTVATVAALPIPSTQGFGFRVTATGDLHIFNGSAWVNAGQLQGPKGDQGDIGNQGPPGNSFSYQGTVATVAALPIPSTQGFGFRVTATGDLHIFNGSAWVNAGPLQGPKGDQGDQGIQGNPGAGFSYQGTVATVAALPTPSTQGFGFKVTATGDLHIFNGSAWVNAGPLQGPKGDQGNQGIQGNAGSAATIGLGTVSTGAAGSSVLISNSGTSSAAVFNFTIPRGDKGDQGNAGNQGNAGSAATIGLGTISTGAAGSSVLISNSGTSSAAVFNFTIPRGDKGDQGNAGPAGPVAGSTGQAVWNNNGSAAGAAGLTFDSNGNINRAVFSGTTYQTRQTVTVSSGVYTLDVTAANEFVTAAAIAGATTINLSNLVSIPNGAVWRGVLSFSYTSNTISWFTGNSGYSVRWDGGSAIAPTASEIEKIVIEVVGGSSIIEVAALRGRV